MPSSFTVTSPTRYGVLPAWVSPVGGAVLDLVGINGRRVVSQASASGLSRSNFPEGTHAPNSVNLGEIGSQIGFTPEIVDALGGGLAELSVRLTIFDGDTGPGDFDRGDLTLLLNGSPLGDFSAVATEETSEDGQVTLSSNPDGGFRDSRLDTGFFHTTNATVLAAFFDSMRTTRRVDFQWNDSGTFNNLFDFTVGPDAGTRPTLWIQPPVIDAIRVEGTSSEGGTVRVVVEARDPDGPDEGLTYEFDLDMDRVYETTGPSNVLEFLVADEGLRRVGVRVVDPDGGEATGVATFTVANLAPEVLPPDAQWADEGTIATLALGTLIDPGAEPSWDVSVDWGDGSPAESFLVTTPGDLGRLGHLFVQDGRYTVTVSASDGLVRGTATFPVRVRNLPPRLSGFDLVSAIEWGGEATLALRFSDPGALDALQLTVDWGEGTTATSLMAGVQSAELRRIYTGPPGIYRVTVTLQDDDGMTVQRDADLEVKAPRPARPTADLEPPPPQAAPQATDPKVNAPGPVPEAPDPEVSPPEPARREVLVISPFVPPPPVVPSGTPGTRPELPGTVAGAGTGPRRPEIAMGLPGQGPISSSPGRSPDVRSEEEGDSPPEGADAAESGPASGVGDVMVAAASGPSGGASPAVTPPGAPSPSAVAATAAQAASTAADGSRARAAISPQGRNAGVVTTTLVIVSAIQQRQGRFRSRSRLLALSSGRGR